ncbi:MAG: hypothetical protein IJ315_00880 [Firmicutes bacterium]|nr:hypothetical protein [Bacillota bacterium]
MNKKFFAIILCVLILFSGCQQGSDLQVYRTTDHLEGEAKWTMGFGRQEIAMPTDDSQPYYIAGYNSGWETDGVMDLQAAQAVWMDAGADGILLIGVDCIALSSTTVNEIRQRLQPLCEETGCTAINVYSTHDHASVDTLGLWGPTLIDGKNDEFMENLINAAVDAATQAAANRITGTLYYGFTETDPAMLRDSRDPQVFDAKLHQLRFEPDDTAEPGIRMYLYGAHAESLRGDNRLISRDFPGVMCDLIQEQTGDHAMFMPGAIGGLIMTQVLDDYMIKNMMDTGRKLVDYALSIDNEVVVEANLQYAASSMEIPLDNTGFLFYKFLGILGNEAKPGDSATGYVLVSEMTALQLGDMMFALIPGEIFPELVWDGEYAYHNPEGVNPTPLAEIAANHGYDQLLVVGLVNDEIGYIVPPSDFLVHPDTPYLERIEDETGENHYEETNSVGPKCATVIADTLEYLLDALQ